MAINQETEMTDTEIDEFLGNHETGVLALARTDEPYAIPISYGYDATDRVLYMRLVSTPDSEKRDFLESSPSGRIVIYDEQDETYRSVVAIGTLDQIRPEELTADDITQYGQAKRPLFEIWAANKRDLDIELYRFEPDSLSGRVVEVDQNA